MTVVGVVKDVREDRFGFRAPRPVWYLPYAQQALPLPVSLPLNLMVRTGRGTGAVAAAVREAIRASIRQGFHPSRPSNHRIQDQTEGCNATKEANMGRTLLILAVLVASFAVAAVNAEDATHISTFLYDDFSGRVIDPAKWEGSGGVSRNTLEFVREIRNGQLRLGARTYGTAAGTPGVYGTPLRRTSRTPKPSLRSGR
jgi:hypothetical protein